MVDTNVLVGALISSSGHNRYVLRACFEEQVQPVIGEALFLEYEDLLSRSELYQNSPLSPIERTKLFEAFLSICKWTRIYYQWRPNLRDEGNNHVIELAVAAGANRIITNNVRDFLGANLRFPWIKILNPTEFREELQ